MSGGGGHIGHKLNPDPLIGKSIGLLDSAWKAIDAVRGKKTSAEWIREAVDSALYYEGKDQAS